MTDWGLAIAVGAAVLFAAACTVLPGAAAVVASLFRRAAGFTPADRPAVLGPLFWYELTRLARRGQQPVLRALYAGVLLVGLLVTYLNEFHEANPITLIVGGTEELVPLDRMASFSERFLTTFLFCQLVGVVLITPVYAGGAVPDERDRGTLDFLRASLLSNREIVAAVLTARLVFVAGLVVTGLPILGLTMLFGGIDGNVMVGAFVAALMTVLSLGGFSLYLGVRGRGLREVLVWAYAVTAGLAVFGGCCGCVPFLGTSSPFTMTYRLLNPTALFPGATNLDVQLGVFVALHGLLAVLFTWLATARIRVPPPAWRAAVTRLRQKRRAPDELDELFEGNHDRDRPTDDDPPHRRRERPAPRLVRVPRVGNGDPLLWKERHFSGGLPGFERGVAAGCAAGFVTLLLFVVGLWLFVALVELFVKGHDPTDILNPLARTCAFAAAVAIGPVVGVRAAVAVARERQRRTLDALFSLPVARRDVLWAKWLTPLLWVRYWLLGVGVIVGAAAVTGSVHPLGLLVAVVLLAAFVPFGNTLGLWLSVRCRTATRAATWFLVMMIVLFLAPLLLGTLTRAVFQLAGDPMLGWMAEPVVESFSVPHAVYGMLFRWDEFDRPDGEQDYFRVVGGLAAALAYALAAWVLWRDAVRVFDKEGK